MAKTSVKLNNASEPAPRWYRLTKRVIYLITSGSILTGTLSRFGVSSEDQVLIIGWLMMLLEVMNIILANGETYAKKAAPALIGFLILLSGCSAEKRATKHMLKAWTLSPSTAIQYCRQVAPVKQFTKDSFIYLPGATVTIVDTLEYKVDCKDSVKVKYVKVPSQRTVTHDTIVQKETTVVVDDVCESKLVTANQRNTQLQNTNKVWMKISGGLLLLVLLLISIIYSKRR